MITDVILPILEQRFPGKGIVGPTDSGGFIRFPAIHPEFGDIELIDDVDEITLIGGNFSHGHFGNYEEISEEEKHKRIAESVADFLTDVFADRVVFWGSHKGIGGWKTLKTGKPLKPQKGHYIWSGPTDKS